MLLRFLKTLPRALTFSTAARRFEILPVRATTAMFLRCWRKNLNSPAFCELMANTTSLQTECASANCWFSFCIPFRTFCFLRPAWKRRRTKLVTVHPYIRKPVLSVSLPQNVHAVMDTQKHGRTFGSTSCNERPMLFLFLIYARLETCSNGPAQN